MWEYNGPKNYNRVHHTEWVKPLIGFVLGTWGLFAQQAWWGPLALTAAVVSSLMILWLGWTNRRKR